ncbi:hypothetical protein N7539_003109 [Penicillium diatomitis]|uniref:Uncharacterized protein n=1 Tax=Penicillium diatomitis TaxID=2819901 RepID=A0A9W9XH70_9EURO|nr:uncharacterized protein N7539_003109 [Penicillium diatomitis]KAJ5491542.1 hypothetical protein N7539_003109 [Penicillium diatomitis]
MPKIGADRRLLIGIHPDSESLALLHRGKTRPKEYKSPRSPPPGRPPTAAGVVPPLVKGGRG